MRPQTGPVRPWAYPTWPACASHTAAATSTRTRACPWPSPWPTSSDTGTLPTPIATSQPGGTRQPGLRASKSQGREPWPYTVPVCPHNRTEAQGTLGWPGVGLVQSGVGMGRPSPLPSVLACLTLGSQVLCGFRQVSYPLWASGPCGLTGWLVTSEGPIAGVSAAGSHVNVAHGLSPQYLMNMAASDSHWSL